jgi:hypothetical protein
MVAALDVANAELIDAVKVRLREGLVVFETHEAQVVERGADELMSTLRAIPEAVAKYHERVATAIESHLTWSDEHGGDPNGRAAAPARRAESAGTRAR